MIAPQDAAVARRDQELPGLMTVLDPEALAAQLPPSMRYLERARIAYARYKPGQSCVVGYCAPDDGAPKAYAKAHRAGAPAPGESVLDERGLQRFVVRDGTVSVSVFPVDARLKFLRRLASRKRFARQLEKLMPEHPECWSTTLQPLHYMPERRFVAKLVANGRAAAVLKVYSEDDYPLAGANADAFRSQGPLRVAPLLARSDRHRVLVFQWIEGRSLNDAMVDPAFDVRSLSTVGAALAELHGDECVALRRSTGADEAATLRALVANLSLLCPELAPRLDALGCRLAGYLEQSPPVGLPIHGDFGPKQVVLSNGEVTLLDFDRSVRGDPAVDLGLFLAWLEREVLLGRLRAGRLGPIRDALLAGYRGQGRLAPVGLEPHAAIGLLRLAAHPFRERDADWPGSIAAILGRAEKIAGAAGLC